MPGFGEESSALVTPKTMVVDGGIEALTYFLRTPTYIISVQYGVKQQYRYSLKKETIIT